MNICRNTLRFIGVCAISGAVAGSTHFLFSENGDDAGIDSGSAIGSITIIQGRLEGRPGNRLMWKDLVTGSPLISGQVIRTDSTSGASLKIANAEIEMGPDALLVMQFIEGEPTISVDSGQIKINADESSGSRKALVIAGNGKKMRVEKSVKAEISAKKGQSLEVSTISGSAPREEKLDEKTAKKLAAITPVTPTIEPKPIDPPKPEEPTAAAPVAAPLTEAQPPAAPAVNTEEATAKREPDPETRPEQQQTPAQPPSAPVIISPLDGDEIEPHDTAEMRLKWKPVENAGGYDIEILDKQKRVFFEAHPAGDRSQQRLRQMHPGSYTVRIRSRVANETSKWSSAGFKVNLQSAAVGVPGTPHIQATGLGDSSSPSLLLKWQPVSGVKIYEVRLIQDGNQIGRQQTTATSFLIPETLDDGKLVVCSIDSRGEAKACTSPIPFSRGKNN